MSGGWERQMERVRRWHRRLIKAHPDDKEDFLYAFFENAFHLRDWLISTDAASQSDMDALFRSKVEMRLCRDLANGHKHFSINRPSQPAPPSELWEYVPGSANTSPSSVSVVLSGGKKYNTLSLANKILEVLEKFIEDHVIKSA